MNIHRQTQWSGFVFAAVAAAVLVGCSTRGDRTPIPLVHSATNSEQPAPLHLGTHRFRPISCTEEATEYFDRGLALTYGFNYDAADSEFAKAAELDPNCAMAWWGVALVAGPHINFPLVPPDKAEKAFKAMTAAKKLLDKASPIEAAMIRALDTRYAEHQPADRSPLDRAFADAMGELWKQNPTNSDIGAIYADALMDLHPWDFWKPDGSPQEWTPKTLETLEAVLKLDPGHAHAHHLYIRAIEASPNPEKAVTSADTLRTLIPGSGHLVHMPAHIYIRVGRWEDSAQSNIQAMNADVETRKIYPRSGFYSVYMAHSVHFLAFTRMMQGQSANALQAAREMVAGIPDDFLKTFGPIIDGFLVFPSEVLMRFGRWDEVLKEPAPKGGFPFSTAMWHYTRTAAHVALGNMKQAAAERRQFDKAVKKVPATSTFGNNLSSQILEIATLVLDGELAAQKGQLDKSIEKFRLAVTKEDQLRYDEPPDWIQPVRHTLGSLLLRAGKHKEGEAVYLEDLKKFPENGWSLYGLARALELQGRTKESNEVYERFQKVWAKADVQITTTCYCQAGK